MTQVANFLGGKGAFFGAQFQLGVSESLEDLTEAFEVLFPGGSEHDDIIEIEEARFPVKTGEDAIHEAGEGGGSAAEAEIDLVELEELATASTKSYVSLSRSWIGTCQYPLLRSRVENQRVPCKASMLGRGCASLMVAVLSCRKSTQKRRLPSFFLTMTAAGEAQRLLDGLIMPLVSICWT